MEWLPLVLVAMVVYTAIYFAIRANVRRLIAMRPEERSVAVRRQLVVTTVAAFAMLALALLLASE